MEKSINPIRTVNSSIEKCDMTRVLRINIINPIMDDIYFYSECCDVRNYYNNHYKNKIINERPDKRCYLKIYVNKFIESDLFLEKSFLEESLDSKIKFFTRSKIKTYFDYVKYIIENRKIFYQGKIRKVKSIYLSYTKIYYETKY